MASKGKCSSRYFINTFPNFHNQQVLDPNTDCIKGEFYQNIHTYVLKYTGILLEHCKNNKTSESSIYTGRTGKCLALLKVCEYLQTYHADTHSKLSNEILEFIPSHLTVSRIDKSSFSFLCGTSGPLAFHSYLSKKLGHCCESKNNANAVVEIISQNAINFAEPSYPDELLYGKAGYLYSLLYLHQHDLMTISHELFDMPNLKDIPSISSSYSTLFNTVDTLFNHLYPSGNLPSSLPVGNDHLVQWCHGSPGAIYLALRCYSITQNSKYYKIAEKMAADIWSRGLIKKGPGLCHGVAGNAYSFLAIYNQKKDIRYLYYALMFATWIVESKDSYLNADRPFSLFEGLAGALHFLVDLYQPSKAMFPGFQTYPI